MRLAKWLSLLSLIAIITVLIGGGTVLGSERGRLWLTHAIVDKLNHSASMHISIEGLAAPRWAHWKAASIRVRQDQQLWIAIEKLDLKWQPKALLDQHIVIEEIHAGSVSVQQLPADNQPEEKTTSLADLLSYEIPALALQNLNIDSLKLHGFLSDDAANDSLHYKIKADAYWLKNDPLQINLTAQGLDDFPATIKLQVQSGDWVQTNFTGSLREPAGGFFGGLLQLPAQQSIEASFDIVLTKLIDRYGISIKNFSVPLAGSDMVAQGNIALSPDPKALYVDDIAIAIDETHHSIVGSWVDEQLDFKVDINKFPLDITQLWQQTLESGELSAQLEISGTASQPEARGKIDLETVYKDLPVAVDFLGALSKSVVSIDQLNARLATAELQAQGKVDIAQNTSELKVSAVNFDLKNLQTFDIPLPDNLEARFTTARASLSGPIKNPRGELVFTANGVYEDEAFSLQSRLTKDDTTVFIQQAVLAAAGGNVSLKGSVQPDTLNANIDISADALSLSPLKLAGIELPDELIAKLDTQLHLSGNLRNPSVAGDAKLAGVYQTIPFVLNASGRHDENNSELKTFNVTAFDEQVLIASGQYQQGEIDIRAQAKKLPSALFSALGWRVPPGSFNADIHAHGSMETPKLDGQLNYATTYIGYDDEGEEKDISFVWNIDINTGADSVDFVSTFTRDKHQPGRVLLQIPTQPYIQYASKPNRAPEFGDVPLQASLKGQLNLQTTAFFLDSDLHRLIGFLNTDMKINGTLEKPLLTGKFHIEEARYENPVTGTLIDNIDCQVRAEQITLRFDSCEATDGYQGRYALAGEVQLPVDNSSGNVALKLKAQNAHILRRPDIESEAAGEILLSGDFTSLLASGNLEVAPFTAVFDANFSSGIPSINIEEVYSQEERAQLNSGRLPVLPILRFDLVITANKQAYLSGHGLEAELRGKIKIRGDINKPLYEGEFKTVRGVFDVFNKKFNLERGQINFANDAIGIAITGIYEKNNQRIQADISGTNDDIKINFSAVPQIPEDEILAFIIFGKPIQTITPFEAVQLASAVQTLRSGGASFFDPIGKTKDALGIDTLSIESAATEEGGSGVNVGIGKYLNEKVYLELERTPNPSQPWKGNLEIELTPNINLESSTGGQTGIEGAELKWKRDY